MIMFWIRMDSGTGSVGIGTSASVMSSLILWAGNPCPNLIWNGYMRATRESTPSVICNLHSVQSYSGQFGKKKEHLIWQWSGSQTDTQVIWSPDNVQYSDIRIYQYKIVFNIQYSDIWSCSSAINIQLNWFLQFRKYGEFWQFRYVSELCCMSFMWFYVVWVWA